ncbi:MAG: hypothetical protein Q4B54_13510, partial [Coriobacteriales bacterium]|nr:hypothetical protein [Coriobacteriales bacterium]
GYTGKSGTITISGGTVTATGGNCAAGIGAGCGNGGGTVTISGGTVTANGGTFAAGIGGGGGGTTVACDGCDVTFSGGTVAAKGGAMAEGIGRGSGHGEPSHGNLTLQGVAMSVSDDGSSWKDYDGSTRTQYMKSRPEASATPQVQRLYNPNSGEHFYTLSVGERDLLVAAGWKYEGTAFKPAAASSTPVYRLYNPYGGHHYTASVGERDLLVLAGWHDEGVGWYGLAS